MYFIGEQNYLRKYVCRQAVMQPLWEHVATTILDLPKYTTRGFGRCRPFRTCKDDHQPQKHAATRDAMGQDKMPTTTRMCHQYHQSHHGERSCVTIPLCLLTIGPI